MHLVLEENKVGFEFPPRAPPADAKKFDVVEGVLAICPKTNVGVIETETHYQAETNSEGCKISFLREISKRTITREEAKTLVENGKLTKAHVIKIFLVLMASAQVLCQ